MKIDEKKIKEVLQRSGLSYKETSGNGKDIRKIYELQHCLKQHGDSGKLIFFNDGGVVYKCHHDSCKTDTIVTFLQEYGPELLKGDKPDPVGLEPVALTFTNGSDLAAADLPPIRWIVDNFLPAGLVKLVGDPKTYKSFMVLDLCLSVCLGRPFLGKQTTKAGALYFDLEASKRRAKARMLQVLGDDPAPETYYTHTGMEGIRQIGAGFEVDLEAFLDAHPEVVLVVVDVFIKIRPARKANEVLKNEYLDTQGLWKIANDRNICIVLVEHTNKQTGAKPFDRIAGANTSRGSTDVNMVITREPDSDSDAILSVEGREVMTDRYVLHWNKDTFRWDLDGRFEDLKAQRKLAQDFHEFTHHDAVKTIRGEIKEQGFWSGYMADLVDQSECDVTPKKMGAKIKYWSDSGFFEREDVSVTKQFLHGKWKYTFKTYKDYKGTITPKGTQVSLSDFDVIG